MPELLIQERPDYWLSAPGKQQKIPQIQDAAKEYWAEIKIGVQTESYDTEKPEILPQDISGITEANIQDALKSSLAKSIRNRLFSPL